MPALSPGPADLRRPPAAAGTAPNPVSVRGELAQGIIEIVDTAQDERMRFVADGAAAGLRAEVRIARAGGPPEILALAVMGDQPRIFWSSVAPQEPHQFEAQLILRLGAAGVQDRTACRRREAPH